MDNKLVLAQDKLNPKPEYDPHILYNAINLTAELQYKVPMQRIYDILVILSHSQSLLLIKLLIKKTC